MEGASVKKAQSIEIDMSDYIEIPLEDDNKKYNRAKVKREWQKKLDKQLEEDWER